MVFGLGNFFSRSFSALLGSDNSANVKKMRMHRQKYNNCLDVDPRKMTNTRNKSKFENGGIRTRRGVKNMMKQDKTNIYDKMRYLRQMKSEKAGREKTKPNIKKRRKVGDRKFEPVSQDSNTPLGLIKRLWNLKRKRADLERKPHSFLFSRLRDCNANDLRRNKRNNSLHEKQNNPGNQSPTRRRRRPTSSRKKKATKRRKSSHRTKSTNGNTRDIRVKIVKRYKSGETERGQPQVKPLTTRNKEMETTFNSNPKSLRRYSGNANDEINDDPLNFRKLHRSYAKRQLFGTPAYAVDQTSGGRRKSKERKASRSPKKKAERKFKRTIEKKPAMQRFRHRSPLKKRNKIKYYIKRRSRTRHNSN